MIWFETSKLYILKPVWWPWLPFCYGHSYMRNEKLLQSFSCRFLLVLINYGVYGHNLLVCWNLCKICFSQFVFKRENFNYMILWNIPMLMYPDTCQPMCSKCGSKGPTGLEWLVCWNLCKIYFPQFVCKKENFTYILYESMLKICIQTLVNWFVPNVAWC